MSIEEYSVSNRGLRTGLVGTPEVIAERLDGLERAGVDLVLLQCSPQREEMERFAAEVIPLVSSHRRGADLRVGADELDQPRRVLAEARHADAGGGQGGRGIGGVV